MGERETEREIERERERERQREKERETETERETERERNEKVRERARARARVFGAYSTSEGQGPLLLLAITHARAHTDTHRESPPHHLIHRCCSTNKQQSPGCNTRFPC